VRFGALAQKLRLRILFKSPRPGRWNCTQDIKFWSRCVRSSCRCLRLLGLCLVSTPVCATAGSVSLGEDFSSDESWSIERSKTSPISIDISSSSPVDDGVTSDNKDNWESLLAKTDDSFAGHPSRWSLSLEFWMCSSSIARLFCRTIFSFLFSAFVLSLFAWTVSSINLSFCCKDSTVSFRDFTSDTFCFNCVVRFWIKRSFSSSATLVPPPSFRDSLSFFFGFFFFFDFSLFGVCLSSWLMVSSPSGS